MEYRDPKLDGEQIADGFFSPEEKAALRALPEGDRRDAFFACWTRKEAYLKARGIGLTRALEEFTVSVSPEEPAALLAIYDDPSQAGRWSLADLSVPGDYAAAVAVEGPPGDLDYFRVPPGW